MSNLSRGSYLKEIFTELWAKAKEKFAKLNEDNNFTGRNTFTDGYIKGAANIDMINTGNLVPITLTTSWYASEGLKVPTGQLVTKLIVAVDGSKTVGETISGIRVCVARNRDKVVVEDIISNGSLTVVDCTSYGLGTATRAVELTINKYWNEEMVFAVQVPSMLWGENRLGVNSSAENSGLPAVGKTIPTWNTNYGRYIGIARILSEDISFKDLSVTEWNELDHVIEYDHPNIFNYSSKITGQWYGNSTQSTPSANADYSMVYVDVEPSQTYTVFRKQSDNNRYFFLDKNNTRLDYSNGTTPTLVTNTTWYRSTVTTGSNASTSKMVVQFQHGQNNTNDSIMVFKGDYNPSVLSFVSYTGTAPIVIDSKNVSISYSSSDGSMYSATVNEAIDELRMKSVKTWGDLEHVADYPYVNLLDTSKLDRGKYYETSGVINNSNSNWSIVQAPVQESTHYTIIRKQVSNSAWKRVAYINAQGAIMQVVEFSVTAEGGYQKYTFETPAGCVKIGTSVYHADANNGLICMLIEGQDISYTGNPIPYNSDLKKIAIAKDVSLGFDNTGSNLTSDTVENAIKELNAKIGTGTVKQVNGVSPADSSGAVTIEAQHINANISGQSKTVQDQLTTLTTKADNHDASIQLTSTTVSQQGATISGHTNRIAALEAKPHPHVVGEMKVLFYKPSSLGSDNDFTLNGATYIYCGDSSVKYLSPTTYSDLANALGKPSDTRFMVPYVQDEYNATTLSTRYHYICAKIG